MSGCPLCAFPRRAVLCCAVRKHHLTVKAWRPGALKVCGPPKSRAITIPRFQQTQAVTVTSGPAPLLNAFSAQVGRGRKLVIPMIDTGPQVAIMVPLQPLRKMLQSSVAQETRSSRGPVGAPRWKVDTSYTVLSTVGSRGTALQSAPRPRLQAGLLDYRLRAVDWL